MRGRALLVREGEMELHDAVDGLQHSAEAYGLLGAIGQDAVQEIMARAFAAVRPELARRNPVSDPPPDAEPRDVARSALDAAAYLIRKNDPKRFETWLLQHSATDRVGIIAYLEKC